MAFPYSCQAKNMDSPKNPGLLDRIFELLGTSRTGEVSKILDIAPATVSDWKKGRSSPTIFHITEVANISGSTADWIVSGDGPKNVGISVDGQDVGGFTLAERQYIRKMAAALDEDEEAVILLFFKSGLTSWGIHLDVSPTSLEIIDPMLRRLNELDPEIRRTTALTIIQLLQARLDGRFPVWYQSASVHTSTDLDALGDQTRAFSKEFERYQNTKRAVDEVSEMTPVRPSDVGFPQDLGEVSGGEVTKEKKRRRKTG